MNEFLQNSVLITIVWVIFAALTLYLVVVIWSHLSLNRLFWQNIFGSNRVALPEIARDSVVSTIDSNYNDSQTSVVERSETETLSENLERRGVIYPMAGRNGLHFWTERCTSCQLCSYVCPVGAITTSETAHGYLRIFDLTTCIYCGLCEAACPTHAIRLTLNENSTHVTLSDFNIQGEIEKSSCPECGRSVPQPDLLADNIYDLALDQLPVKNNDAGETLNLGQGQLLPLIQSERPCPTCRQSVAKLEEKICG